MQRISSIAEELLYSQGGFRSMQLGPDHGTVCNTNHQYSHLIHNKCLQLIQHH